MARIKGFTKDIIEAVRFEVKQMTENISVFELSQESVHIL